MAISVVQKAGLGQSASSSSQASPAFGVNTTAGNALIGIACTGKAAAPNRTISSVTGGGTFGFAVHDQCTNINSMWGDIWVYVAYGIAGGSTTGVTFNLSAAVDDFDVGCLEVSGIGQTDQTNGRDSVAISGATSENTGSITPTAAASLVLAVWNSSQVVTWTGAPAGYTNQFQDTGSTFEACSVDTIILSSSSAQNPSWTMSPNNASGACMSIVSFIAAVGGIAYQGPPPHFAGTRKHFLFLEETKFRSRHAKRLARKVRHDFYSQAS